MKLRQITAVICISMMAAPAAWSQGEPEFGYSGKQGPKHWASLNPAWSACGAGQSQSPINISKATDEDQPELGMNYQVGSTDFVNNGRNVQVDYDAGSKLTVGDGASYELRQFHFHSPSEHQVDGKNLAAEIHLVHADANGNLAVVSLLVEEHGGENHAIARLWNDIPGFRGAGNALTGFNVADLLPEDRSHYAYSGSLTTPPCSENVQWFVMKQPVNMSVEQVATLKRAIGVKNNRPVQALNGRTITD